jgi:hypothetical protein
VLVDAGAPRALFVKNEWLVPKQFLCETQLLWPQNLLAAGFPGFGWGRENRAGTVPYQILGTDQKLSPMDGGNGSLALENKSCIFFIFS